MPGARTHTGGDARQVAPELLLLAADDGRNAPRRRAQLAERVDEGAPPDPLEVNHDARESKTASKRSRGTRVDSTWALKLASHGFRQLCRGLLIDVFLGQKGPVPSLVESAIPSGTVFRHLQEPQHIGGD